MHYTMTQHPPTLAECHEWVLEHCTNLLNGSSTPTATPTITATTATTTTTTPATPATATTTTTTTMTTNKNENNSIAGQGLGDCLIAIDSTRIFVNALDAPLAVSLPLIQKLDTLTLTLETATESTDMISIVIHEIGLICETCTPWLNPISYMECKPSSGLITSKYQPEYPKVVPHLTSSHYAAMWPDAYNCDTAWFRQYFVGNPYVTLIGPLHSATGRTAASLDRDDPSHQQTDEEEEDALLCAIISVVQETIKPPFNTKESPSSPPSSIHDGDLDLDENEHKPKVSTTSASQRPKMKIKTPDIQYRLIIRTKKGTIRYVIPDITVRNTLACLEVLGQGDRLETSSTNHPQKQKQKRRPLRSFSSAIIHHTTTHLTSSPSASSSLQQCHHYGNSTSDNCTECHHEEDDDDEDDDTDLDNDTYHHHRQISDRKCYLLYRLLNAAILSIYTHLDLRHFKALSAESTILAGLEKELLRFDEMEIPKNYKFGLLTVRDDQVSEEKWFSNSGLSGDLEAFLNIIGQRVTLQDYKGYAAGLDTKCGESGKYSYVTTWKENDIMFHVGPLMPSNAQDKQQVHRKRYIGNDIVCLVFMETDQPHLFDPKSIRSQFLHVFIVVHPETRDGRKCWRVEVVSNKNVEAFGPPIPSPPLFFVENELREFLLLKLVSAENAALQSDKFAIPNAKARQGIFKALVDMGLAAQTHSLTSSNSFLRSKTVALEGYLAMIGGGGHYQQDGSGLKANKNGNSNIYTMGLNQRPKSAGPGGRRYSRASLRSLRAALDISTPTSPFKASTSSTSLICCSSPSSSTSSSSSLSLVMAKSSLTPEPPTASTPTSSSSSSSILFPYTSRSNMLRDLKNLTRRRHSTASTSSATNPATTTIISRTPTPSSMVDRSFRTNSPPINHPPCYSPPPFTPGSHHATAESPVSWIEEHDTSIDISGPSTSLLSSRSYSSSSLNNGRPSATASSSYYSSPPSPPPTLDMMKWVGPGETNQSIRSRAHHLMSAVIRRKQQSALANSSSSSMISRMSRSKSSYIKD